MKTLHFAGGVRHPFFTCTKTNGWISDVDDDDEQIDFNVAYRPNTARIRNSKKVT